MAPGRDFSRESTLFKTIRWVPFILSREMMQMNEGWLPLSINYQYVSSPRQVSTSLLPFCRRQNNSVFKIFKLFKKLKQSIKCHFLHFTSIYSKSSTLPSLIFFVKTSGESVFALKRPNTAAKYCSSASYGEWYDWRQKTITSFLNFFYVVLF